MTDKTTDWPNVNAPVAETKSYTRIIHQDTVVDEYFWLNDYFKKGPDSSAVIDYLEAENAYLETMMSGTRDLQTSLFNEMKGRIKKDDESVPYYQNGYYYYTRTEEGSEYFKFCRKKGDLNAPEEILLNVDKMAAGYAYFAAVGFNVSPDNQLIAYGVDTLSRRQYTIHIKNIKTGEVFQDRLSNTTGGSVWANDNRTLFYTAKNESTLLSEKIKNIALELIPLMILWSIMKKIPPITSGFLKQNRENLSTSILRLQQVLRRDISMQISRTIPLPYFNHEWKMCSMMLSL